MRILLVEDDQKIATSIKRGLELEGYAVDVEHDGESGYYTATSQSYDAIITDIMMPKMNGFELIEKLREEAIASPIIALTARTQSNDVVSGLDRGADDYLTKPFSFDVLLARLRALMRRPAHVESLQLSVGDLTVDPVNRSAKRGDQPVALTVREFALLEYLVRNKNKIIDKDTIIAHVWDFDADILPNTVEVYIRYLRSKLEKPFRKLPKLIHTVRGFGYMIKDPS